MKKLSIGDMVISKNQTAFTIEKGSRIKIGVCGADGTVQNVEAILDKEVLVWTCGTKDELPFIVTRTSEDN